MESLKYPSSNLAFGVRKCTSHYKANDRGSLLVTGRKEFLKVSNLRAARNILKTPHSTTAAKQVKSVAAAAVSSADDSALVNSTANRISPRGTIAIQMPQSTS
jgi:hypothetical protein